MAPRAIATGAARAGWTGDQRVQDGRRAAAQGCSIPVPAKPTRPWNGAGPTPPTERCRNVWPCPRPLSGPVHSPTRSEARPRGLRPRRVATTRRGARDGGWRHAGGIEVMTPPVKIPGSGCDKLLRMKSARISEAHARFDARRGAGGRGRHVPAAKGFGARRSIRPKRTRHGWRPGDNPSRGAGPAACVMGVRRLGEAATT